MAEHSESAAAVVGGDRTCGICLEDSKDPVNLPCGHSFCDGCIGEWRSRYGVKEEMRRKCPICRATIPPSKEMVSLLLTCRAAKQGMEDDGDTSSVYYHGICQSIARAEEDVGADWDGVTVLEDSRKPPVALPDYVHNAIKRGDTKSVLRWINANRTEDRVNAISSPENMGAPALCTASVFGHLTLMTLLLQLGADVNTRDSDGTSVFGIVSNVHVMRQVRVDWDVSSSVRLLLSWGAVMLGASREDAASAARFCGKHELANLLDSELGGRRCEIVNLSARPELNGKTCVTDEYLPDSNQYKVTLETKSKEVLVLGPDNLNRRDRTPQDCGYYVQFKNDRTIRHDFDSNEDCQAFVAALNNNGEIQPAVTEESEAAAEQAAAELLAELGLDDSPSEPTSGCKAKKSKKKRGGKKKKTK
ncbi:hypothetical protein THAOC_07158 [Thalassiosira oceanica]|uniref:RING-type domain-containing protein n=1 Tax=Thalassiosira oceanica TaxID=159749 RepID=K0TD45_THAOC|nr:hypothetical protein THAOC_07158 [Thalassiosira oceanica]|eukprot:EJK71406.1 hypothetical protein THAOC_07158 [Thalassiosira oceanica]